MAVYYQSRYQVSKGYDVECTQPSEPAAAPASLACKIYPGQDTEQGRAGLHWLDALIAWPEGITAWLLLLTLGAIFWQAQATADSAAAAFKSVQLQEVQFKQWVEIALWENLTHHIQPSATEATLTLNFEVGNATKFPLTLRGLTTTKGAHSSSVSTEFLIAPDDSYSAFFAFDVTPAELELYRRNQLIVTLSIEAMIRDVLERDCPAQRFTQTVIFGPTKCEATAHPRHVQLKIKQTG